MKSRLLLIALLASFGVVGQDLNKELFVNGVKIGKYLSYEQASLLNNTNLNPTTSGIEIAYFAVNGQFGQFFESSFKAPGHNCFVIEYQRQKSFKKIRKDRRLNNLLQSDLNIKYYQLYENDYLNKLIKNKKRLDIFGKAYAASFLIFYLQDDNRKGDWGIIGSPVFWIGIPVTLFIVLPPIIINKGKIKRYILGKGRFYK
tara:strand:+ start:119 stop:721 length:603 start_codon:yes stop_codon:yes gene_type:complete